MSGISMICEMVDNKVKEIALGRRIWEVLEGQNAIEYDNMLNEQCEKWYKVFADMSKEELLMFMINDLAEMTAKERSEEL